MPGRSSQVNLSAAISKATEASLHAESVREHVRNIAESAAFKGSERSREFLLAIVEKALAGKFEELKERVLGVELFGRVTSYDTGEDAIVRVTASDVRRRLQRYYREFGVDSQLRLEIPTGSYIPEFSWAPDPRVAAVETVTRPEQTVVENEEAPPIRAPEYRVRRVARPLIYVAGGFLLGLLVWAILSHLKMNKPTPEILPWSSLLLGGHQLQIVLSDTDLGKMQTIGGYDLSLPDYANHRYIPSGLQVSPEVLRVLNSFRGLNMGTPEVTIALAISKRLFPNTQQLSLLPARGLELKDFRTDDNFVLLGSPRSNPWVALFQDQLDFQFFYDADTQREVVRNRKPRKGELTLYRPSARGWGTGDAFGLISFIPNPNQAGRVLLIAGSSAEATEAAGQFVLDRDAMSSILQANGILRAGAAVPFQALLRVNTMAGSPNSFSATAFHRL